MDDDLFFCWDGFEGLADCDLMETCHGCKRNDELGPWEKLEENHSKTIGTWRFTHIIWLGDLEHHMIYSDV